MATTAEEVQRAIERARAAQDNDAVSTLEGYLKTLQPSQPAQPAGALPGNDDPIGQGVSGPALTKPQRERRISQLSYEHDQSLLGLPENHPQRPTKDEINQFRSKHVTSQTPDGRPVGVRDISKDVVRDPNTGEVRWAALSPDQIDSAEAKKKAREDTKRATGGALKFGTINPIGEFIDAKDKAIESRNITQQIIWEQMPSGEKSRIINRVREEHGDKAAIRFETDAGLFPSNEFKKLMDENPDNNKLLDTMEGDEWWEERKETVSRVLSKIGSAWNFGAPIPAFGADTPTGALTGKGKFEGIDYAGKDAPLYAGASEDIREWRSEAKSGGIGLYENVLKPLLTSKEGLTPGERVIKAAQTIKEEAYTAEQLKSSQKPFIPEGKTVTDMFSSDFWTDPNTKMPWNDWTGFYLTFMENAPQIAASVGVTRVAGGIGARHAAAANTGRRLQDIEAARKKYAGLYGVAGGGSTEGFLIHNNVAREVGQSLAEVPMEIWREDQTFNDLVAAGLNEEEAKQLLTQDAASAAGTTAFAVAGLAGGAPMGYMIGQSGAGRLASKATAGRVATAALGEPLQEGTQEVIEGEISDIAIAGIDPDNPIFSQENRRLERFAGGAFVTGPTGIGALATIEYGKPAGYQKADVEAATAAKTMMDAVNERYKLELKLSDPEYRTNTEPMVRLKNMQKLENLQRTEAETVLKSAKVLKGYLADNPSQTSKVEAKRLATMEMQANATLTDIAVARSRRQTVSEMAEEQENILMERAMIQQRVADDLISLEDINRQVANIEAVQNNEAVSEEAYEELVKEGYGRWTNQAQEKFVIKPKGKRALNLLNQQSRHLSTRIKQGYTGTDRRNPLNQMKRDLVDSAGPVEREQMLYTDNLTGAQNRRAFKERSADAKAVAAVDVDSLAWVNDHMTHAAGDRLLVTVADAIGSQNGVEVFRLGGDEFAVTGASQEALETALQAAAKVLQSSPIADAEQEVRPTITWGKGETYEAADKEAGSRKAERIQRGQVASRKDKPASWSARAQLGLFHWTGENANQKFFVQHAIQNGLQVGSEASFSIKQKVRRDGSALANQSTITITGRVAEVFKKENEIAIQTANGSKLYFTSRGWLKRTGKHKLSATEEPSLAYQVERSLQPVGTRPQKKAFNEWLANNPGKPIKEYTGPRVKFGGISNVGDASVRISSFTDVGENKGLFQLDKGAVFPHKWSQVSHLVKRGSSVEVLTPDGAEWGIVTKVKNAGRDGKRPRVTVNIDGRVFTFNPDRNHLITHGIDTADFVWITGWEEYSDPLYGALPQIVPDVQIGHVVNEGEIIADLYKESAVQKQQQLAWWTNDYPEWHPTVPYVPPLSKVSEDVRLEAEALKDYLTRGYSNLPEINMIYDLAETPETVRAQIIAEGASIHGVHGYMNHINPKDGIYIFVPNIYRGSKNNLESGITETLLHEMIGHYGVRGFFGNEAKLREMMNELVDAFPKVADARARHLKLNKAIPNHKQLLGEEMIAYLVGEHASGKVSLNKKQKGVIEKIISWIRQLLVRMRFIKGNEVDFWNDARVRRLVSRSYDFVRNGKGFEWTALTGEVIRFDTPLQMRDGDIFQQGVVTAITTATEKITTKQQKQKHAKQYGGVENVPQEVPMFPESASPNIYRLSLQTAVKAGYISKMEMKYSGLDESGSDYALLRDAKYNDIKSLMLATEEINPRDWYKNVLPFGLAKEVDALYETMDNSTMVGPLIPEARAEVYRGVIDQEAYNNATNRIQEIMDMPIDQKNATISKKILLAHAASNKALRINVIRQGGHPNLEYSTVAQILFGPDVDFDSLTDFQTEMIDAEKRRIKDRGPFIGYNEEQDRWLDWANSRHQYREYIPQGAKATNDYRVALVLQEGSHEMGSVPSAHWGVPHLMHIRTAVADIASIEGAPVLPPARNPEMEGKALSMIELQANWLQELRYAYTTPSMREDSARQYDFDKKTTVSLSMGFVTRLSEGLWDSVDKMLKPIYNAPTGALKQEYLEFIESRYGQPLEEMSEATKREAYTRFNDHKLTPIINKISEAKEIAKSFGAVRQTFMNDLPGLMDARVFDRLDTYAVSEVTERISDDLTNLISGLHRMIEAPTHQELVATVGEIKSRVTRNLHRLSGSSTISRLAFAKPKIVEMVGAVLEKLEFNDILDVAMEPLDAVERVAIRIPVEAINEYRDASKTRQDPSQIIMLNILSNSRLLDAGINPNGMHLQFDQETDPNYFEITAAGTKEHLTVLSEKLPNLIRTYVSSTGPVSFENWLSSTATSNARERNSSEVTWDEVKEEFGFTEVNLDDPSHDELSLLREHSVQTYEQFETYEFDDIMVDTVNSAFENMDWSEVYNDDGEGLWPGSTDFTERVEFDDDGDADTDNARQWLSDARESYRSNEMFDDDSLRDSAYDEIRERWDSSPAALILGVIPVEWDEDGEVTDSVAFRIAAQNYDDYYDVFINDEEVASEVNLNDAQQKAINEIRDYYNDRGIILPHESLFSPTEDIVPDNSNTDLDTDRVQPDWLSIANRIIDSSGVISLPPESGDKIFERMVSYEKAKEARRQKGIEERVITDTPLKDDSVWRPIALKYLLSDAVRRGFPAIIWNNGLASSKRGGNWGVEVARPVNRIVWTQETMTLRGETHDMIVIRTPDLPSPIVVDARRMIPILGRDLSTHIIGQINGKIPLQPEVQARGEIIEGEAAEVSLRDHFLLSTSPSGITSLHRRSDGGFVGLARGEDEVQALMESHMESHRPYLTRPAGWTEVEPDLLADINPLGSEIKMTGIVTEQSLGTKMRIIAGGRERDYHHTYAQAKQASARESYEGVMHRIWEKELKKYGATIQEAWVKGNIDDAWNKEGQPIKKIDTRSERIAVTHGKVSIEELRGETHGYIAMSERSGLLTERIFESYARASEWMEEWKDNNFGEEGGVIKVYYVAINDKIVEEFSGPVAPFHYDPTQDPVLKEAAEKIGYEDVSFRDRYNKWREAWRDKFNQGMFDRFHGIKRALSYAHETNKGYIQTRLTTSLDSVMKSVMEYGPPVWSGGIVQSDAKIGGFLDILQPVMAQIDLWGMYMAGVRAKRLLAEGREKLFSEEQIDAMVALGDKYPQFARVAAKYAEFNKKILDFAEEAGVINPDTRSLWENADYVPFYRVEDERLVGPFSGGAGVANQRSPIKRLKGGDANIGNVIHNIMVNMTKLVDTSMKNQAALTTVDALRGSGIVSKQPMTFSQQVIPLNQVKKLLIDRGMNPETIPVAALEGFQKMFAVQPPEGPGVISILRDGKKEFYYTDDDLLYRAMTNINKKHWGSWMNLFRAPKRLLTTMITLDPGFMAANYVRDSLSAFVLSRDHFIPVASGIKGFGQALVKDKAMRTMLSAGAAFESGYINQYDPKSTDRVIKDAMKKKTFSRTVLNTPKKLFQAWKAIGSATENANRMAVYNAAIAAGKSEMQAVFEAKDLMDFSMGGDWPAVQFLIQTVPFMGARMQGLHRLGRGFAENPAAFLLKGTMVGMAGMALFLTFRDDERYKELEEWDKDTYFHWWIGDNHYRLPKPFEVGAIFNTIPERIMEYAASNEKDAPKLFWSRMGHMFGETFNMNPVPQTLRPMTESYFNYNFFAGRSIVSPYEADRMAPEQYRYSTSPTMVELGRALPAELDVASSKIRSPLHLANLFYGYTGTLGKYFLLASDAVVRDQMDYPNPPELRKSDWPVVSRFFRGSEPRRTKYEEETYRLIKKVSEIQGSLRFLEKTEQEARFEDIQTEWEPYIRVAKDLEDVREDVSDINAAIMNIWMDPEMDPKQKRIEVDSLQKDKNMLFELGYELRPGGPLNTDGEPVTQQMIKELIDNFGVDDLSAKALEGKAPETFDLISGINTLGTRELQRLAEYREQQ